jgi:hypothetical protein
MKYLKGRKCSNGERANRTADPSGASIVRNSLVIFLILALGAASCPFALSGLWKGEGEIAESEICLAIAAQLSRGH